MSSSNTEVFQERFVLPGDDVSAYVTPTSSSSTGKSSGQVILSRGTRRVFGSQSGSDAAATTILASAAGVLKCNSQGSAPTYSVQSRSGFYTPLVGDQVSVVVVCLSGCLTIRCDHKSNFTIIDPDFLYLVSVF